MPRKTTASIPIGQARRSPGRPRDHTVRDRILDAATKLFVEQGANVSVDKVAELAGTTKMTLYSHFESKEGLLRAALTRPFTSADVFDDAQLDPGDPSATLLRLAQGYLELATGEDTVAQILALYGGAGKDPATALAVYESGPAWMIEKIAKYLKGVSSLRIENPAFSAEQFLSLVRGMEQTRAMLSLPPGRRGKERDRYLESCVSLFLRGYSR